MDEGEKFYGGFKLFYWFTRGTNEVMGRCTCENEVVFLNNQNQLHNLNGPAYYSFMDSNIGSFWINGRYYLKVNWEVERNRMKMLNEL